MSRIILYSPASMWCTGSWKASDALSWDKLSNIQPYIVSTGWYDSSCLKVWHIYITIPDSKVHVAHMGPTWVLSTPGVPHVGPMNLAIRVSQDCIARVIMSQQIDMAPTRQDESYQHLEDCMLKHVCANAAILYPQVWLCVEIILFFVIKM